MDTKALEKFCPWARVELIDAVKLRCVRLALDDAGRAEHAREADAVRGTVLTSEERSQRMRLFDSIERLSYEAFCEQAAYSWFNRFAAIRYMELHGYLPCGVRILSGSDGSFSPECLKVAADLNLPGLPAEEAAALIVAGNDEALFRRIVVAQCNELATCMPTIFAHVDDADALTLPDNLLREGEHNVVFHLVTDIPEDAWNDVETLGWMYQFYNAARKAEFFASKRKAAPEDLAPATQLFTPDWIVRYMTENSLGRLWMLNHPESHLAERMDYFIKPDERHEDFIDVTSPEDITACDPACGSGHILSYAFDLLFRMYEERGYREREIPSLILEKNLYGLEIDPRAAQIASLVLTMRAREHDRRFFGRGVVPHITVLESIEFGESEVPQAITERKGLADTLAHLGEIGSLFAPEEADVAAIETALDMCTGDDLFGASLREKLEHARDLCRELMRTYDVAIANPPYMGSGSFNPFMNAWMKKHYPDVKSDLFSAFIVRIMDYANEQGEIGIMCPFVWMFIGSYEKLRNKLIDERSITSLIQLEYSGFSGATVPICTFTFHNSHIPGYKGGYVRLSDFVGAAIQGSKALEAIQNPDCGWFYRADATTFHDIPGSPIAYWASNAVHEAYRKGAPFSSVGFPKVGMQTSNNDKYLRLWWESDYKPHANADRKWIKYLKGGSYRKWYGNLEYLLLYKADPNWILEQRNARVLPVEYLTKPKVTWTDLTSGANSFRLAPVDTFYDISGHCFFPRTDSQFILLGLANSSVFSFFLKLTNSSMHCQVGDVASVPVVNMAETTPSISKITERNVSMSALDWNSQETSWEFKRHPLV